MFILSPPHNRLSLSLFAPFCLVLFSLLLFTNTSLAMPAAPDLQEIRQPDGKIFKARLKGDEWNNSVETEDGYSVDRKGKGHWYFIDRFDGDNPILTKVKAHEKPPSRLKKHLRKPHKIRQKVRGAVSPGTRTPGLITSPPVIPETAGLAPAGPFTGSVLYILVEFSNRQHTYTADEFAGSVSNSIHDYYNDASYGNVIITPAVESSGIANNGVIGWLNLGYKHPNTGSNADERNREITRDAINAADPYIDYSQYDTNHDGYVDSNELSVVIVVAGYERSYSNIYTPNVWGHRWSIFPSDGVPLVDGVWVGDYHNGAGGYAQFGEIHKNSPSTAHLVSMGIMVHELGHLMFGLPDLYDTDSSSSGIGAFGLMSGGSWGRAATDLYSGETPVLPCAWSKYTMQWAAGTELSADSQVYAAGSALAGSSNSVFLGSTDIPHEFFLVENRRPLGYDRGLEGYLGANFTGGLAIWHVDETISNNTDDLHRLVDLEEADGTEMLKTAGSNTDLWTSANGGTFNGESDPSSILYDGSASNICIASSAPGEIMTTEAGCPVSGAIYDVFADDMESGAGNWSLYPDGTSPWGIVEYPAANMSWFSADEGTLKDDYLVTPAIDLTTATEAQLTFEHHFSLENSFDGGVIEISTDGGSNYSDLGSSIVLGGYTRTISSGYGSAIAGRNAWTGESVGLWSSVIVNLDAFVGETVRIRFRLACDESVAGIGWYIDNVNVLADQIIYQITATAGANGSIAPAGEVFVAAGTNQEFSITPDLDYHVADVLVDSISVGSTTAYLFDTVTANHTISAAFALNDLDGDGIADRLDNCPGIINPEQFDGDNDGIGDLCEVLKGDLDFDGDVDGADLEGFAFAYENLHLDADLDDNSTISAADAAIFAKNFGAPYLSIAISANGSNGPLTINSGEPLNIEFVILASTRRELVSDWWLTADTPNGFYYLTTSSGWTQSAAPYGQAAAGIMVVPDSFEYPLTTTTGLYRFTFSIDNNADGIEDATWATWVDVLVQ